MLEVTVNSFSVPTTPGTFPVWRAPLDAYGGGVTVLGGGVVGSGTATVALAKFSSAGTPALNGTIGAAVGGTFTAGVPASFTISSSYQFVDAGEWVGLIVTGTANVGSYVNVRYAMGK